ncbi:hypothetical protein QVD17_34918 [Tagetes erecta]|uniref:Transmembrane protein n=1 Tax=Tagetes erecta TaxID=13708 RepID=A0AAD8JYE7_TARER|nr:hypothetical protein QVD17_34918 [Tagetes erecta]
MVVAVVCYYNGGGVIAVLVVGNQQGSRCYGGVEVLLGGGLQLVVVRQQWFMVFWDENEALWYCWLLVVGCNTGGYGLRWFVVVYGGYELRMTVE